MPSTEPGPGLPHHFPPNLTAAGSPAYQPDQAGKYCYMPDTTPEAGKTEIITVVKSSEI